MNPLWLALGLGVSAFLYFRAKPQCPRHIVALGDSITAGNYIHFLGELMPKCTVDYVGFPGDGARSIYRRVYDALDKKPDDLIVLAGVNDIASGRDIESVKDSLNQIYTTAKSKGVRVIAVTVLPWRGYGPPTETLNAWILGGPEGVTPVDTSSLGDALGGLPSALSGDNLHPNVAGKKALARLIREQAY